MPGNYSTKATLLKLEIKREIQEILEGVQKQNKINVINKCNGVNDVILRRLPYPASASG